MKQFFESINEDDVIHTDSISWFHIDSAFSLHTGSIYVHHTGSVCGRSFDPSWLMASTWRREPGEECSQSALKRPNLQLLGTCQTKIHARVNQSLTRPSPVDLATPTMSRTPRGHQIRSGKPPSATFYHFLVTNICFHRRNGRYSTLSLMRLLDDRIWRMTMAVNPTRTQATHPTRPIFDFRF